MFIAPDALTMNAMVKRDQKLRSAPGCQRAISLPLSSRQEINHQIRLRVVREFNLPDPVAYLLEVLYIFGFNFEFFNFIIFNV